MDRINMLLEDARGLIDTPENWTKEAMARNEQGHECPAINVNAISFCVVGSVERAADKIWGRGGFSDDDRQEAIKRLAGEHDMYYSDAVSILATWQDASETTHDDVMALFDRAIEKE